MHLGFDSMSMSLADLGMGWMDGWITMHMSTSLWDQVVVLAGKWQDMYLTFRFGENGYVLNFEDVFPIEDGDIPASVKHMGFLKLVIRTGRGEMCYIPGTGNNRV